MAENTFELPLPPWSHEALGEEKYCELATKLGFFNPKAEPTTYRPDLDPTPFLDQIRGQHKSKIKNTGGGE